LVKLLKTEIPESRDSENRGRVIRKIKMKDQVFKDSVPNHQYYNGKAHGKKLGII